MRRDSCTGPTWIGSSTSQGVSIATSSGLGLLGDDDAVPARWPEGLQCDDLWRCD
jgi:hypothetical protein